MSEIKIDSQIWMQENLNVAHFRNGDIITEAKTEEEWLRAKKDEQPAWCYFDNDANWGSQCGKLYNWFAVNDSRGLAPNGWRIPSQNDFQILIDNLGGKEVAGAKMKSTSGWFKNGNGNNQSDFNLLPGGCRFFNGTFFNREANAHLWLIDEESKNLSFSVGFGYLYDSPSFESSAKGAAMSVRCIKL